MRRPSQDTHRDTSRDKHSTLGLPLLVTLVAVVLGVGAWLVLGGGDDGPGRAGVLEAPPDELPAPAPLPLPAEEAAAATPLAPEDAPAGPPAVERRPPLPVRVTLKGDAWGVGRVRLTPDSGDARRVDLTRDRDGRWVGTLDWRGATRIYIENEYGVSGYVLAVVDVREGVRDYEATVPKTNLHVKIEPPDNPHHLSVQLATGGPGGGRVIAERMVRPIDDEVVFKQAPAGDFVLLARYRGQSRMGGQIQGLEPRTVLGMASIHVVDQPRPNVVTLRVEPARSRVQILDAAGKPVALEPYVLPAGPDPIPELAHWVPVDDGGRAKAILPGGLRATLLVRQVVDDQAQVAYGEATGLDTSATLRLRRAFPVELDVTVASDGAAGGPWWLRLEGETAGFGGVFHVPRTWRRDWLLPADTWTATLTDTDGGASVSATFVVTRDPTGGVQPVRLELRP